MKHSTLAKFSIVSALILGSSVGSVALGDGARATGASATGASATGASATGTPAAVPAAAVAPATPIVAAPVPRSAPRVEIFEFTPVDKSANPAEWIGKGIRENLQSDVSKTGATLILPAHPAAAGDDQIAAAKAEHADLAVTGTYQVVGDQIRVNAHLIDVASNTAAGGFSATGSQHDLFQVEDALGEQFRRLLPRPATPAMTATVAPMQEAQPTTAAQPELTQAPAPTIIYQQPAAQAYAPAPVATYEPDFYYPGYGYGDYGYGYGGVYPFGFYGGIGIYGGAYRGGYYGNRGYGYRGSVGGFHGGGVRGSVGGGVHVSVGGGGHGGGGHR